MKQLKLSILLTVLMNMVGVNAFAHDFEVANADGVTIYYNKTSDTEVAVSYRGSTYNEYSDEYTGNVVIPASVTYDETTYSVTSIGERAFRECTGLTSITIPNSVISISKDTFKHCSDLTTIIIPNSVTSIGEDAFKGTAWYNNLPDGLIYAGKVAYKYKGTMPDNTSIIIEEGTVGIADEAFTGCSNLIFIEIPNSVTNIGKCAFSGCSGLTSVEIPSSVTSIGSEAFEKCNNLTMITIPNSVTSIGDDALRGTAWYNNQPDGLIYAGKVAYKYKGTMPDNMSITFEEGTVGIAGYAFEGCIGLTSVTIPNSVTNIGRYAFTGCIGLTSITIPNSVTSIGERAFNNCVCLTSVTVKSKVPVSIDYHTFSNQENATLYVPKGCKAAYEASNVWKDFKEIVEVEEEPVVEGDADGDGKVDVNDVTSTINYILNKPVANFIFEAADMDNDGKIDVNDVQAIIYKALGKDKTYYYYYVGPDNPMEMTSISPIVTSQAEAGWYKIGETLGTYSLASPLLDASDNMIPMGSRTYDYIALPNNILGVYNVLGASEMEGYTFQGTKVLGGITYYVYKDNTLIRYFGQFIY